MKIDDCETLEDLLLLLMEYDCYPSIYRRGNGWRAHVNRYGNFWEDHEDPKVALEKATENWEKAGRPMDGEADV